MKQTNEKRTDAPESLLIILMPLANVLSLTTGDALVFGETDTANGNSSLATNVAKHRDDASAFSTRREICLDNICRFSVGLRSTMNLSTIKERLRS